MEASRSTRRKWAVDHLLAPVLAGLISGLTIIGLGFFFGAKLADRFAKPTCDNPRDTLELHPGQIHVKPSSVQPPDVSYADWGAANLIDGDTTSHWVPSDAQANAGTAWVKFTFTKAQDLQLICVVNGDAADEIGYFRAGRVRTALVKTDPDVHQSVSPLLTLNNFAIQNPQPLNFNTGKTRSVVIRIQSVYDGRTVFEPKNGVLEKELPTNHTALSEVEFYVAKPSTKRWWSEIMDRL